MNRIQATIPIHHATDSVWDAIVIGAGCAGAIAARQLALGGARTLLVDKAQFPRYKVCGCCFSRPAQLALASIGLGGLLAAGRAVPTHSMHVAAGRADASIPLPEYMVLSRERFDAALVRAAIDAGVAFLPGVSASAGDVQPDARTIRLTSAELTVEARARILIVADGLGSRLLRATDAIESTPSDASRIGAGAVAESAPTFYRPGVIYMACAAGGYVGACRLEDGRLALATAYDVAFLKLAGGMANAAQMILSDAGFPEIPEIDALAWKGTPALTRSSSAVTAPRAFVVGDAAGYVEPFTGEGMKWAITSAVALAPIALGAIAGYGDNFEREWRETHRRIVTNRTAVCRGLAASLRHPWLVRAAIHVIDWAPGIAAPFVRRLNVSDATQKEVLS